MKDLLIFCSLFLTIVYTGCDNQESDTDIEPRTDSEIPIAAVSPVLVTDKVKRDSDDPAIWVNRDSPENSLIIGTDKGEQGALYVYDLNGDVVGDKVVQGLQRPNNVDVEYDFMLNGEAIDIAVVSERLTHKLRIYKVPEMEAIDNGGIPVFEGETEEGFRETMGISLYRNPTSGQVYAIAGRKNGPTDGTYLWQYLLEDNGTGQVKATLVRKFGEFSGNREIEAIAVDDKLGYVYYSDETSGVRKYYADPEKGNEELAFFATEDFAEDQEGIAIYETTDTKGYILVSDQQNNRYQVFTREGSGNQPHEHKLVKIIDVEATESDGAEVTNIGLNDKFGKGLLVAMSNDKTFHYYSWEEIAGEDLDVANP